jgi:ubiquinone/menaquinone biosynthesis C-methylase UbiE
VSGTPPAWAATLDAARTGAVSPEIALARLLLSGEPPEPERLARLAAHDPALAPLAALAARQASSLAPLARLAAAGLDPEGDDLVAATAALFDRVAATSPEAAVAFYSLGDPALLARATAELAAVVRGWAAVEGADVLDLGCGIGRLAVALAPVARSVIGIDVSAAMVAEARARTADLGNVRIELGSGRDLAGVGDAAVDVVVAADSFPYLVRAGIVAPHLVEIARVLRPGGRLAVFNWSYRGDPAVDRAEAEALGAAAGLAVRRAGEAPFAIWDAPGFLLERA